MDRKAISSVVSTALILVVTVASIVGFGIWFNLFESTTLVDIGQKSNYDSNILLQSLINDKIYLKSNSNQNLTILKVTNSDGDEMCEFSGTTSINSTGLVGHWTFDDNSKNITDKSGNNNYGILYGTTKLLLNFDDSTATDQTAYSNDGIIDGADCSQNGVSGSGCVFDGVNDEIIFTDSKDKLNQFENSSFSWSFWFNGGEDSATSSIIDTKDLGSGTTSGFSSAYYSNSVITCTISDGVNFYSMRSSISNSNSNYNTNSWNNLICVLDRENNMFKIYLNGVYDFIPYGGESIYYSNSSSQNNISLIENLNSLTSTYDIHLGSGSNLANTYFNGSIDEFAIYSKALSQAEISDLYNSQKAKFLEYKTTNLDSAVEFDGMDNYVKIKNTSAFDMIGGFTIFIKSKPSSNSERYMTPLILRDFGYNSTIGLFIENNSKYYFEIKNEGRTDTLSKASIQNVDLSHFSTLTLSRNSSDNISFSVNNLIETLGDVNGSFNFSYNTLFGGHFYSMAPNGTDFFKGQIDEIRIYNRTLSESEISQLYWYSVAPQTSGPNQIDLSSCNLIKNQPYSITAFTDSTSSQIQIIAK